MKKFLCTLLCLMLVFTMMPMATGVAFAALSVGQSFYTDFNGENATNTNTEGMAFEFTVTSGTDVSVSKANDNISKNITIPATVEFENVTYAVTSIGDGTFAECSSLTNITIPASVTQIGDSAFQGCKALMNVTFETGSQLKSIGFAAFNDCSNLGTVDLTSCSVLEYIDNYAFAITKLTNITIPASVKAIGIGAFNDCSELATVTCLATTPSLKAGAFPNTLTTIYVPASKAFDYINDTTKGWSTYADKIVVTIADVLATAYGGFPTSSDTAWKDGCKKMYKTDSALYIDTQNFSLSTTVTKIESTENYQCTLDAIAYTFHMQNGHLIKITGSNSSEYLPPAGSQANPWEIGTPNASDIIAYVNDGILHIEGSDAMKDFNSGTPGSSLWETSITSVVIDEGVTSIGDHAFNGCTALTSITIPTGVISIGDHAFLGCTSLTNIEIPSSVQKIEANVFDGCTGLTRVNFDVDSSLESILANAFQGCSKLEAITIPDNVEIIAKSVFSGCSNLKSVEFSSNSKLMYIYESAFNGCTSLKSVTIPAKVKAIAQNAFQGCKSITNITIPASMKSIGESAFNGCSQLATVTCLATTPLTLGTNAFASCTDLTSIYVPYESVDAYKAKEGWSTFADKIQPIPGTEPEPEPEYHGGYVHVETAAERHAKLVEVAETQLAKTEIKSKSKLTKLNGKKAVKISWSVTDGDFALLDFDGFDVFRSTKKYSGYGNTPYFTTTKTTYKNNKDLEKGKTYYYKVRAYKMVDGEKVYTGWSTKAWRTVK